MSKASEEEVSLPVDEFPSHECACVNCEGVGRVYEDEARLNIVCCEECSGLGVLLWEWEPQGEGTCEYCWEYGEQDQINGDFPCKACYVKWHTAYAVKNGCKEWKGKTNEPSIIKPTA